MSHNGHNEHNETTTSRVAKLAAKGLRHPESLTTDEIKIICASALTQSADKELKSEKK